MLLYQEHYSTSLLRDFLRKEDRVLLKKVMICGRLASYYLSFSLEKLLLTDSPKKKCLRPSVRGIGSPKKYLPLA
jgi:hypothetical protein